MRRLLLILALALASGLLLAPAATAFAQTADDSVTDGRPLTSENVIRGQGQATSDAAAAAATGELDVTAAATAGRPLLGLIGGRSTASAAAAVQNTFPVAEGSYTVTFTYDNASAMRSAASGASATVIANSVATFTSADEADKSSLPFIDFTEVRQAGGDLVITVRAEVPEAGSLFTVGRFIAQADSTRRGAAATATGSTDGATVSVARNG